MGIDLSALDAAPPPPAPPSATADGSPLKLRLALIDIDPAQPRKEFDEAKLRELAASIKEHGVLEPVSVRPHPTDESRWVLNFGERRYRASMLAGLEEIPAFVARQMTGYAQVIENLHREALSPMELAMFISARKANGEKNAEIARQLAVDASVITQHLSLIDAPSFIEALYATGRCTSPKILYDLSNLHKSFPDEVEAFAEGGEEVTRAAVAALSATLKAPAKQKQASAALAPDSLEHSKESARDSNSTPGGDSPADHRQGDRQSTETGRKDAEQKEGQPSGGGAEGQTSWPRGKVSADATLMKRPLLVVSVDGRTAAVLLNRKPTSPGHLHVCFENGENAEVSVAECLIVSLSEEA